ncbi:MAG: HAMP domain-containing histidine kinase [Acidimicrobiia bacterium]|nr:HAMP domain-containing histidine kinase [Acidimicrobiia bacterium]
MRLAARTGLAAFAAAFGSLLAIGAVFQGVSSRILLDRVDDQLEARAETAPILAAIANRLAASELSGTVEGAQVLADGRLTEVGLLPAEPLPAPSAPGLVTATADGQRWRLLTIEVRDVPRIGDEALVQLAAPLGDTEAATRRLRRRALLVGLATAVGAGLAGYVLGARAVRPLISLRRDAARLDDGDPSRWRVASAYGSVEVDEVAAALNHSLGRLAEESERRGAALESARAFASSASHELRAPLQSALTNLNLVTSGHLATDEREAAAERATAAVEQTAAALAAVRSLAEAEFADASWFAPVDLADLVEAAVAAETRRADVVVEIRALDSRADDAAQPALWADGVQLAVANLVRNAVVHGCPDAGSGSPAPRLVVTVEAVPGRVPTVTVDDNGPGIPAADRARVVERFERGSRAPGSGLGLAIARQVAVAHGGTLTIGDSPVGGARVTLRLGPG